jgi:hypothetical protein
VIGIPANRRGWVLATALAVALAGCGHSGKPTAQRPDAPRTTATPATATPTTTSPTNAALIAAWHHYWDVYVAVGSEMNLPDSRLAEVATGTELRQLGGAFLADESRGHVVKGTIDLYPRVISVTDGQAQLADCYFSRILVFKRATNQPVGAGGTNRTHVTATLQLLDGTWKVAAIQHDGDACTAP